MLGRSRSLSRLGERDLLRRGERERDLERERERASSASDLSHFVSSLDVGEEGPPLSLSSVFGFVFFFFFLVVVDAAPFSFRAPPPTEAYSSFAICGVDDVFWWWCIFLKVRRR